MIRWLVAAGVFSASVFSNCSNVNLEMQKVPELRAASAKAGICLEPGYTIDSFFVTNMNLILCKTRSPLTVMLMAWRII